MYKMEIGNITVPLKNMFNYIYIEIIIIYITSNAKILPISDIIQVENKTSLSDNHYKSIGTINKMKDENNYLET